VCHSDFAPYNCVFRGGRFVGAIDFDLCAPGPRLWDLAYTAYRFVPLMPPADATDVGPGERSPFAWSECLTRLETFLSTYAAVGDAPRYARAVVVRATAERLGAIAAWTEEHVARTGDPALAGNGAMYRDHAAWLLRNVG
jgi:Ser/Thr protein kinase RdoA (MazF antagonist)